MKTVLTIIAACIAYIAAGLWYTRRPSTPEERALAKTNKTIGRYRRIK